MASRLEGSKAHCSATEMVSAAGLPDAAVIFRHSQCPSATFGFSKLVIAVPVLVLVMAIGSVVTVVPASEASAPWPSTTLTLGLSPPVSTASRRLIVRGAIGPGGLSREAC